MKISSRLVACPQCQAKNTLDSKFCRSCGAAVPEDDIVAAKEKNVAMVHEGMKALASGNLSEALLIAQSAIEVDEQCAEAWVLLANAREKNSDWPAAHAAYQRLDGLEPGAVGHKLKIQQLNDVMNNETHLVVSQPEQRRRALLGGVAATLLIACVGSAVALIQPRDPATTPTQVASLNTQPEASGSQPNRVQLQNPATAKPEPETVNGVQPVRASTDTAKTDATKPNPLRGDRPGALPNPTENGRPSPTLLNPNRDDSGFEPVNPNVRIVPEATAANTNSGPEPSVSAGTVDEGGGAPATKPAPTTPDKPKRPPVYDIKPSNNSKPVSGGGSQSIKPSSGYQALLKQASEAMISGSLESAVSYYKRALSAGAPAGSTNQRIGQCYERIGQKADAIEAYERAIAAFNESGSNPTALDACRRAVQLLRG